LTIEQRRHDEPAASPTVGQSLIDLQKAKEAGAPNDPGYQVQKSRLLAH
jgi:hypothetical protein